MTKNRLEAFSDGVIAIIITVMVLNFHTPDATNFGEIQELVPSFLSYVLSFIYIGIYWSNHHHLLHATSKVNGGILWANLHLLFWLSLVPFCTDWADNDYTSPIPIALYGFVLFMAGLAYLILSKAIIGHQGANSALAKALGKDYKGKISIAIYLLAIALAFVDTWLSILLYLAVAIMWVVPDKRIERLIK